VTKSAKPKVVIFCDHLLYLSETFIRAQAQALQQFAPVYAGSRRVCGLDLPEASTHIISDGSFGGRVSEAVFKLFGSAPALARKLHALRPVLMHAHFGPDGLRALPLSQRLGVPLIVTFHGSDATALNTRRHEAPWGHRRYQAKKHVLERNGRLFIAVSDFIRKKLLEQNFSADKVLVHYIGVDTARFAPDQGEDKPVVLFVSRLVERKGADFLIRAMAEVQKENSSVELVLIGDGPLRGDLERQARKSLRRYRFLGAQSSDVVRGWMDRASVFSVPSVKTRTGEEEALGIVFAEAQAMEKPVVSFLSGGISEVVRHGETGFLSPERDWQGLAQHLSMLLRNADLRRRFGVAGRQRVLKLFDLNTQTSALESIYQSAIDSAMRVPSLSHDNFSATVPVCKSL
jgi:colanic acid/amylovoran biosynthesis glycosyltransferase